MNRSLEVVGTRTATKRIRFTPAVLESKPPKAGRIERRDDLSPLWLRITASGDRSFAVRVRIKNQQQPVRLTFPERAHVSNLTAAREWAVKADAMCRAGHDPRAENRAQEATQAAQQAHAEQSDFAKVARAFLATNGVIKKNSRPWRKRTTDAYSRTIEKRLIPHWQGRTIHSITRDELSDYLSAIADTTPTEANRVLAVLSSLMSWYEKQRASEFTSPIVKGMAPADETARDRILSDDEIRIVWHVAGKAGAYGAIVRCLLLNAARRGEVAAMRRSQIGQDGVWALPGEMTKNHMPLFLPLSTASVEIITAQIKDERQDIIFSGDGGGQFDNWSRSKKHFDRRMLWRLKAQARASGTDPSGVQPLPNWTLHDLRRTARSLMARAKVRPDHAERVLNHVIGGVEGTYDRHSYEDEKRDALERLARLLRQIVAGESAKVVQFPARIAAE